MSDSDAEFERFLQESLSSSAGSYRLSKESSSTGVPRVRGRWWEKEAESFSDSDLPSAAQKWLNSPPQDTGGRLELTMPSAAVDDGFSADSLDERGQRFSRTTEDGLNFTSSSRGSSSRRDGAETLEEAEDKRRFFAALEGTGASSVNYADLNRRLGDTARASDAENEAGFKSGSSTPTLTPSHSTLTPSHHHTSESGKIALSLSLDPCTTKTMTSSQEKKGLPPTSTTTTTRVSELEQKSFPHLSPIHSTGPTPIHHTHHQVKQQQASTKALSSSNDQLQPIFARDDATRKDTSSLSSHSCQSNDSFTRENSNTLLQKGFSLTAITSSELVSAPQPVKRPPFRSNPTASFLPSTKVLTDKAHDDLSPNKEIRSPPTLPNKELGNSSSLFHGRSETAESLSEEERVLSPDDDSHGDGDIVLLQNEPETPPPIGKNQTLASLNPPRPLSSPLSPPPLLNDNEEEPKYKGFLSEDNTLPACDLAALRSSAGETTVNADLVRDMAELQSALVAAGLPVIGEEDGKDSSSSGIAGSVALLGEIERSNTASFADDKLVKTDDVSRANDRDFSKGQAVQEAVKSASRKITIASPTEDKHTSVVALDLLSNSAVMGGGGEGVRAGAGGGVKIDVIRALASEEIASASKDILQRDQAILGLETQELTATEQARRKDQTKLKTTANNKLINKERKDSNLTTKTIRERKPFESRQTSNTSRRTNPKIKRSNPPNSRDMHTKPTNKLFSHEQNSDRNTTSFTKRNVVERTSASRQPLATNRQSESVPSAQWRRRRRMEGGGGKAKDSKEGQSAGLIKGALEDNEETSVVSGGGGGGGEEGSKVDDHVISLLQESQPEGVASRPLTFEGVVSQTLTSEERAN